VTELLDGIDLVIFDKDGTLIEFGSMWSGWAVELETGLRRATGRSIEVPLFAMLGVDPASGTVFHGGGLTATPMARLREATRELLEEDGLSRKEAEGALAEAWHAPDPVALAHPLADLVALFGGLRASGRQIAVATSDDRGPTLRTLTALGVVDLVSAVVCADDGLPVKPAADMIVRICEELGVEPACAAVVGDSTADLLMGRAAGAGRVIGVLTGVGRMEDLAPHADAVIASVAELGVAARGETR
jgi:phosphoglycolate phosphatase